MVEGPVGQRVRLNQSVGGTFDVALMAQRLQKAAAEGGFTRPQIAIEITQVFMLLYSSQD